MRRLLLIVLLLLVLVTPLGAQTAPQIEWRHDGLNVTYFTLVIDGGTPTNLGLVVPVATNTYRAALVGQTAWDTAAKGQHTVLIQACNANGCTSSSTIVVVKL